ncbi:MAG: hypothetical protein GTO18_22015 [Anaerolineales bacterium]|nr:hypothetical protein [Anaerolineales bacterium]
MENEILRMPTGFLRTTGGRGFLGMTEGIGSSRAAHTPTASPEIAPRGDVEFTRSWDCQANRHTLGWCHEDGGDPAI